MKTVAKINRTFVKKIKEDMIEIGKIKNLPGHYLLFYQLFGAVRLF